MVSRVHREQPSSAATALLSGLNPAQQAAVTSEASPLCILAGAGSGKTRVLTRRIAYRVLRETADPARVLALTFTRKAAGELRGRLHALGVAGPVVAGTFHAVAFAQLRRRWADRGESAPALVDRKVRLIAPLLGPVPTSGATGAFRPGELAADVAAEIEWAKARMVTPPAYEAESVAAGRTPPLAPAALAAVYQRYETEKRRRGLVDFEDLLGLCADAFRTDPDFAAAQRWRFRHVFVDEFQDVNPVQFRLLAGWLGERPDLCVVGDPNQAIYSWNGADPRLLVNLGRHFPGGEVVRLEDSYRSTPQILAVADAVLGGNAGARPDVTGSTGPSLRAHQPDGLVPTVESYESDKAEARAIAARLRLAHRPGSAWSSMAVLTRTNAQAVLLEEALRAASIPHRVRGGAFLAQPEVKAALALMASGPAAAPFRSRLHDVEAMAAEAGAAPERRLNLAALVRLGREYADLDDRAGVSGFTAWLAATVRAEQPDREADAVDVATFHRAKGLEWDVVFVAGLEQGLVPIGRADGPECEAEERRLLYVALTRARVELHCSWAERRTFGTRTVSRSPSPYLAAVEAAVWALGQGGEPADWRRLLTREQARLQESRSGRRDRRRPGRVVDADPDVLAALRAWRSTAARAAAVPAYVIFHDTTLAALAEAKPTSPAALLAVPGLGPVKASRYGDALLRLVAEHGRSA